MNSRRQQIQRFSANKSAAHEIRTCIPHSVAGTWVESSSRTNLGAADFNFLRNMDLETYHFPESIRNRYVPRNDLAVILQARSLQVENFLSERKPISKVKLPAPNVSP